ncbi:hypothetical protein [Phyllobacterium zundukense]|uniref:Uncharacterized protein n=1 Tax=Phyllobacterium zundukense TaxID=1867719 RepID=A0A2N9VS61_9HYPH|nr:hypothetical protein [Phyllobacterium zundukense]ATU92752.1 hypothetical protein BLM14_14775 [Phyllobacterium zundukense]PIO42329.1 hypothetical protein B5P45_25230 [Phyllobacterium zundukense]
MSESTTSWASTVTAIATSIGVAIIGYFGYQVQGNSQRAVEEIRAQTAIQQSLLNSSYQTRQLDIEMVKLALNILGGEISDKTKQSRSFAVQVLQKYSGVELTDDVVADWVSTGTVAFRSPEQGLGQNQTPRFFLDQADRIIQQLDLRKKEDGAGQVEPMINTPRN